MLDVVWIHDSLHKPVVCTVRSRNQGHYFLLARKQTLYLLGRAHDHVAAMFKVVERNIAIEQRNSENEFAKLLLDVRVYLRQLVHLRDGARQLQDLCHFINDNISLSLLYSLGFHVPQSHL